MNQIFLSTQNLVFINNVLASLISSFGFIFFLLFAFRPKISISPFICKDKLQGEGDDKVFYFLKIVNKSWFSAYEISATLNKKTFIPTPPIGMINNRLTKLKLVLDQFNHLPPYRPSLI